MKNYKILLLTVLALSILSGCADPPARPLPAEPSTPVQIEKREIEEEEPPAQPEPSLELPQPAEEPQAITYVLNTNTKKFHKPACRSVGQIKPSNRDESTGTREDVLALGYKPCGNCKP